MNARPRSLALPALCLALACAQAACGVPAEPDDAASDGRVDARPDARRDAAADAAPDEDLPDEAPSEDVAPADEFLPDEAPSVDAPIDAALDAFGDARLDAGLDAALDARADARPDVAFDARADARADSPVDTRADSPVDARADASLDGGGPALTCPEGMALVDGRVCVDRWEAAVEEITMDGGVAPWSPYNAVDGHRVRAVVGEGIVPQGYIAGTQAEAACREAGKRLCTRAEWMSACQGPSRTTYPYGNTLVAGNCNVGRRPHPLVQFYGRSDSSIYTYANMNNPGINMQANSLARAGQYEACVSAWGVFDMHGNLHEWISEADGTFKGGFYADTNTNGAGCNYTTTAHAFAYHDYSTGFRCCADPR